MKLLHTELFRAAGLEFEVREIYWSTSRKNVLRGMHFQLPPADHDKLVGCVAGRALDVALDLRRPGGVGALWHAETLDAAEPSALFIPRGVAHGFLALEEDTLLFYATSTVHSPEHDAGVRWDSFGFEWPCSTPILSPRDSQLPQLADFVSPF